MKILLIEDNPGDARLVQELLKETRGHFIISVAEKFEQGLKLLHAQDVDVVLLDLNLPDSRGMATLTDLQTRFPQVPFVIMTSIDDEELARQAVRSGAQDYLVKGHATGELLRRTLLYAVERKQAEETLRESQKQNDFLAGLIHASSQPLAIGYPDGRLGLVNRAFEELTGYSAAELRSIDWAAVLTPPEWRELEREKLAELNRTGRPVRYEKEYLRKEGTRVPIELFVHLVTDEGKPQYYYAFVTDITDRKLAVEALRKAHSELELRVEARTKDLKDLNDSLEQRVAERTAALQAANETLRASRLASLNLVEDAVAARKLSEETSVELRHENEERKRAEADVMKLSEDMAARNVELESANKEMESFIYSISHDLRAPIRTMSGFAKIIFEDYAGKLDAQGKDYLTRIQNGSERATLLIDDLLRLARISRQDMGLVKVDLSRKAEAVMARLREADPSRNVEVKIAAGLTALADPILAEVVLSNVLGNAWKFTSKTPNARIEFGEIEREFAPHPTAPRKGEELSQSAIRNPPAPSDYECSRECRAQSEMVYFVRDNGAGFDQAFAEKMFWPFQRLHSAEEFEGTGIGLTIVERVIRRHGGKVWAEGEPGKGATVYFTLG